MRLLKRDADPYEEVRVLGKDSEGKVRFWRDSLPVSVLIAHVGEVARYVPTSKKGNVVGAALGLALLGGAILGLLQIVFPIFIAGVMAAPFATVGAVLGWVHGWKWFGPQPFWMVRYKWDARGGRKVVEPYTHSRLGRENIHILDLGEDADPQVVGVYRASSFYDTEQMDDERADLKPPLTNWQKLEAGALVIIAIGLLVFLFFFIAAFIQGGAT